LTSSVLSLFLSLSLSLFHLPQLARRTITFILLSDGSCKRYILLRLPYPGAGFPSGKLNQECSRSYRPALRSSSHFTFGSIAGTIRKAAAAASRNLPTKPTSTGSILSSPGTGMYGAGTLRSGFLGRTLASCSPLLSFRDSGMATGCHDLESLGPADFWKIAGFHLSELGCGSFNATLLMQVPMDVALGCLGTFPEYTN